MSDITQLLEAALDDEPDYRPNVDRLLTLAHRRERRRRLAVGGSVLGVGAGVGAIAIVLASTGGPTTRPDTVGALPTVGAASTSSSVSSRPSDVPADTRLTKDTVAALVEQLAGIQLSNVHVDVLPPLSDIDLSAAIASAQGQYLNVQVTPAVTRSSGTPSCADLSGHGPDGDGYTGPCTVTPRPDGGYLVVRSGRTEDGKYAITKADVVAGDGAQISAEVDNQLAGNDLGTRPIRPSDAKPSPPEPVVSHDPPLTSEQLRQLVLALNARR